MESGQHPSASRKDESLEQGKRRATRVRGVDSRSKDGEGERHYGVGDQSFPSVAQEVRLLGSPIGHADLVISFLEKTAGRSVLLERIPPVPDFGICY